MNKKYEFTDETIIVNNHLLHRIRALQSFGNVLKGDLGGFIEAESNLSHDGDCWISDNATVYGDAKVYGNADISGSAKIYGNTKISGMASIRQNATISENADISDSAEIYGSAKIYGSCFLLGNTNVHGNARVYGATILTGTVDISGNAEIHGDIIITQGTFLYFANIQRNNDYFCCGPIGSRNDFVTFYRATDNIIRVATGCYDGTLQEFEQRIKIVHGTSIDYKNYFAAIIIAKNHMCLKNKEKKENKNL